MTQLNPYLNFNGNCREAMTFYADCLGGELLLQPVKESAMAATVQPEQLEQILHSTLTTQNFTLMASDMVGENLQQGNGIALCLNGNKSDNVEVIFQKMSAGSIKIVPLSQTFWGAIYGEITDRFGIMWLFNIANN
jgi:PhnB protein